MNAVRISMITYLNISNEKNIALFIIIYGMQNESALSLKHQSRILLNQPALGPAVCRLFFLGLFAVIKNHMMPF